MPEWGRNVRRRRQQFKFSQRKLSQRSTVSQQAISVFERGEAVLSIDSLIKIANGLGAEPSDLYQWPTLRELVRS